MTKHISHTYLWQKKLQARAIFAKQYSQPYFQAVSCNSSSSVFLNHYRTPVSYTHLTLPTKA